MSLCAATILELGTERFGPPPGPDIRYFIESIRDPKHLESLLERLLTCRSWGELMANP
jgi:hypothetical protein